ncbi:MAG: ATP-binding protein [Eubacteriales bacterium]
MRIEHINIENFGKLSHVYINLYEGINIIKGDNEAGKTTLSAFISFILFGFSEEERKRYTPWSMRKAGGSMIIVQNSRRYEIQRDSSREGCKIYDLTTNLQVFEGQQAGMVFLRCTREGFDRTAYIRQSDALGTSDGALAEHVGNILFTADEQLNNRKALEELEAAKKQLYNEFRTDGAIFGLKDKSYALEKTLADASASQKQMLALEGAINDIEGKIAANNEKSQELKAELDNYKAYNASQELLKIENARKQLATLREAYEKTAARNSWDNFTPTNEYADEIQRIAAQVGTEKEKLDIAEDSKRAAKEKYELNLSKNKNYNIIEKAGGLDEVTESYLQTKSKGTVRGIAAIVCLVLAVLLLGGGVALFLLTENTPFLPVLLAGSAFLAVGITMLVLRSRVKAELSQKAEQFGFDSLSHFVQALDDFPSTEQQLEMLKAEYELAIQSCERQEKEYSRLFGEARELLMKWHRTPDGESEDGISKYSDIARNAVKEIEDAKNLYEKYKNVVDEMLSGVDERELTLLAVNARKPSFNEGQIDRELDFIYKANESMMQRGKEIESDMASAVVKSPPPAVIAARLEFLSRQIKKLSERHDAYELAIKAINEGVEEMKDSVAPRLTSTAQRLFTNVTGGKYSTLSADGSLTLSVTEGGNKRELDSLSAGTRDAAYICMRMALIGLLYGDNPPPLIFDDAFTRLDEGRFESMMNLIASIADEVQIIMFTGRSSELRALQNERTSIIRL